MTGDAPLEGITVADFGQFIAGPCTAMLLAEMGATVVKVEPVFGEPSRNAGPYGEAMVRTNNRDKLGLAVDLRSDEGRRIAERLIAASDVLVQNMRPGVMERLGLGPDAARRLNERLVYASITAFGNDASPRRAGFDIIAQAESGMMSVTGEPDRDPQRVGFTVVDTATAYLAANAVIAALFRRERTGVGAVIDTSLLEVAVHLQGPNWVGYFDTGVEPTRTGNGQPTAAPAAEVIDVKDGQIVLSAYTPPHWRQLCQAIGRPELADDERFADNAARLANRAALGAILSEAFGALCMDEAVDMLGEAGIAAGAIRRYSQVVGSADAERLGVFGETVAGREASYRHAAAPYAFRGLPRRATRSAPALGEHSREVLRTLAYDDQEIDDLVAAGVVVG